MNTFKVKGGERVIVCGAEYADLEGVKVLSRIKMSEDGEYDIFAKGKDGTYDNIGAVVSDIAEVAVCEYTEDLHRCLGLAQEEAPFMTWTEINCEKTRADITKEFKVCMYDEQGEE